jgi:hypothetical protein
MIQIRPDIYFNEQSPYGSDGVLKPRRIIWQGIHTCVETVCSSTGQILIADLPVGHATLNSCTVNVQTQEIFCAEAVRQWLGKPLLDSLTHPSSEDVPMTVERIRESKNVVILNCIDHLYGHAVLKLFNAERHLQSNSDVRVIVIVQEFLRWMVPSGVAEIWTVQLPLSKAMQYYPRLDQKITDECTRFETVSVSTAYSHPSVQNISLFSKTERHNDHAEKYRVTFIWRNDRPWITNPYLILVAKKTGLMDILITIQNRKTIRLFSKLRRKLPAVKFTIAGIGKKTQFPDWIDDQRVDKVTEEAELALCRVYAESRLVIGVHGSSMLLPSAHAGMTIDLMPKERWGNFAQDIVYQESDPRIGSFRYRFFPVSTAVTILAHLIETQLREFEYFKKQMSH